MYGMIDLDILMCFVHWLLKIILVYRSLDWYSDSLFTIFLHCGLYHEYIGHYGWPRIQFFMCQLRVFISLPAVTQWRKRRGTGRPTHAFPRWVRCFHSSQASPVVALPWTLSTLHILVVAMASDSTPGGEGTKDLSGPEKEAKTGGQVSGRGINIVMHILRMLSVGLLKKWDYWFDSG